MRRRLLLQRRSACDGGSANVAVVQDELVRVIQKEMQAEYSRCFEKDLIKGSAGGVLDIVVLSGGVLKRLLSVWFGGCCVLDIPIYVLLF
jgi:hypothetical protein